MVAKAKVAGRLHKTNPDGVASLVSHETIYYATHALPHGELCRKLIAQ